MSDLIEVTPDFIADLCNQAIIALAKNGRIVFYSRPAEYLFGKITLSSNLSDIVDGDDLSIIRHNINLAFYYQHNLDFYWLYQSRIYAVTSRLKEHVLFLSFSDITEVRRQSKLLYQCYQRLAQIEDLAQIGYWELNLAQKTFYWSDGMYHLFALTDKNKTSHHNLLRQHVHPEDIDLYRQKLRNLILNKQYIDGNIRIIDAAHTIKQCRFSAYPIYINGDEGACGILQDITDYCRNSNRLTIASLGHDVKNHLQLIRLYGDLLANNHDNSEISGKIAVQVGKIALLLNNAVDLARDNTCPILNLFALKPLLFDICQEFQTIAKAKNIQLMCRLKDIYISSNQSILSSIMRNLLDNALKFAQHKVILGNNADKIWIIDDGCGISPDQQNKIFDRFYQASDKSGWGLGLYTVKENAKRINAEISLKSRPNRYTVFCLKFLQNNSCQIAK